MKNIILLFLAIITLACTASEQSQPEPETEKPTNIIFLIGDGMGLSAVSTGFYYGDQPSVFKRFQEIGLQQTSSAIQKVTDSAASGTALATGTKTYNGAIGVDTSKTSATPRSRPNTSSGTPLGCSGARATPGVFGGRLELARTRWGGKLAIRPPRAPPAQKSPETKIGKISKKFTPRNPLGAEHSVLNRLSQMAMPYDT